MTYNYRYAKLNESGGLEYAPLPLVINGKNVWTNIEGTYNEQGYYLIERTDTPIKEGYYYTEFWELAENKIVQRWEEHENPVPVPTEETVTEAELKTAIQEGVNSIDN